MIGIIDYGVGNINAFLNVYKREGIATKKVVSVSDLDNVQRLILPGVGSFDHAMRKFNNSGLRERVEQLIFEKNTPIIGICVGMQMLANSSSEGNLPGLGWIEGQVKQFDQATIPFSTKFPHMGWNIVEPIREGKLLSGLGNRTEFYFLHSYYFECALENDVLAISDYGVKFASVINKDNIYGIQCHPEKSHDAGVQVLKNFANI